MNREDQERIHKNICELEYYSSNTCWLIFKYKEMEILQEISDSLK